LIDASILVLGGGVGGLVVANVLKEKLGDRATVTLVERKKVFEFPPSYPWLMIGMRTPNQVQRELSLLEKKGIEVVNDEVASIDLVKKTVGLRSSSLRYDYLVVALGADYAPETIPGLLEHAHHIYDLGSAVRFKEAVHSFAGGTIAIGVSRTPFKCPAAPYEVALLLDHHYKKEGLRDKVRFEFFTPEPHPVPSIGPQIGEKVAGLLASRGIPYHPKMRLSQVRDNEALFEGDEKIGFDLLFTVPPHRAPRPVVDAGLTDATGWVLVDPRTLETKAPQVYAVGDVTALPTPSGHTPYLPKAGVFAHGQAEVVANNIAARVKGRGRTKEWDGYGACFLEVGSAQSAFVRAWFLAEPRPKVEFHSPSRIWHMQKVLFEKYWMHHWF